MLFVAQIPRIALLFWLLWARFPGSSVLNLAKWSCRVNRGDKEERLEAAPPFYQISSKRTTSTICLDAVIRFVDVRFNSSRNYKFIVYVIA